MPTVETQTDKSISHETEYEGVFLEDIRIQQKIIKKLRWFIETTKKINCVWRANGIYRSCADPYLFNMVKDEIRECSGNVTILCEDVCPEKDYQRLADLLLQTIKRYGLDCFDKCSYRKVNIVTENTS